MLFDLSDRHFFFDPFSMHFFASPNNPIPALTPQDLAPEYASRLLHEVTHLDCMRTDLGTGLVMGMLWLRDKLRATGETDPLLTSDGQTLRDPRTGNAMLLRPLLVRKILYGFAEATPTLEGLAMFAQLDLRFSSEDVSSLHFRAALALLAQAGGSAASSPNFPAMVSQYHDRVREHAVREERLLDRLLFAVDRRNSYYLFGYIFVKSLAFILREKERRFRDPEMAYLFLKAFLLNGASYIDEGVLGPGHVSSQLQGRLDLLLACPPERLRAAYDALSTDTTDRLTGIDWAHFLHSGTPHSATEEAHLRTALDGLGVDHDDLTKLLVSMDFVPLKMVPAWIGAARIGGEHVQMAIASGVGERSAQCVKWVTRDDFGFIEEQGARSGKVVPLVTDLPPPESGLEAIGDHRRISVLWTSAFSAEKLAPISLWSSPGAVFSDDGSSWTRLRGSESAYLNFFERRRFADFIFDVIGPQLPGAGMMLWDFSLFVFQKLMKIQGGRRFDRLLDHGFSIMSGPKSPICSGENLSAAAREQINGLLVYPVFD